MDTTDTNWQAVEDAYRAGILPLGTICRNFDITRSQLQAKSITGGWSRDLLQHARAEIAEALLLNRPADPRDAVAVSAAVAVEVIRSHRKDISRLRDIAAQTMERLGELVQDGITFTIDQEGKSVASPAALVLGKAQGIAGALDQIASAYTRIVELERIAFGLNESPLVAITPGAADPTAGLAASVQIYLPQNHRDPVPE